MTVLSEALKEVHLSKFLSKKNCLMGREYGDLTFDNQGCFFTDTSKQLRNGNKGREYQFWSLCPEIESMTDLRLWEVADERKEEVSDIFDYKDENESDSILRLTGNYRTKSESYFELLTFKGKLDVEDLGEHEDFFAWDRAPFLKHCAETINTPVPSEFTAPLSLSVGKNSKHPQLHGRSTVIKIARRISNQIEVRIPYASEKSWKTIRLRIPSTKADLAGRLNRGKIYHALIGFQPTGGNYYLLDIFSKAGTPQELDGAEVLQHFVLLKLYNTFLAEQDFFLGPETEIHRKIENELIRIRSFMDVGTNLTLSWFESVYLDSFFEKDDHNEWYYKPILTRQSPLHIHRIQTLIRKRNNGNLGKKELLRFERNKDILEKILFLITLKDAEKKQIRQQINSNGHLRYRR